MFEPMKRRLPLPCLLLLPLLAVLLFGNCGGGVRGVINNMGGAQRTRFRAIFAQRQAQRAVAQQQLRGRARRVELRRLNSVRKARIDSLLRLAPSYSAEKYAHRRRKMTRQLLAP